MLLCDLRTFVSLSWNWKLVSLASRLSEWQTARWVLLCVHVCRLNRSRLSAVSSKHVNVFTFKSVFCVSCWVTADVQKWTRSSCSDSSRTLNTVGTQHFLFAADSPPLLLFSFWVGSVEVTSLLDSEFTWKQTSSHWLSWMKLYWPAVQMQNSWNPDTIRISRHAAQVCFLCV